MTQPLYTGVGGVTVGRVGVLTTAKGVQAHGRALRSIVPPTA